MSKASRTKDPTIDPTLKIEEEHWRSGIRWLAGVDDCGRGPLSGPVVTAGVVLSPECNREAFEGVRDSKRLSSKRIVELDARLRDERMKDAGLLAWGIGAGSVREIERLNIRGATILAMKRALAAANRSLANLPGAPTLEFALVDGLEIPELGWPHEGVVKGDSRALSIACASIIAKACRDRVMERLAFRYPSFSCWASDKGYPSPAHLKALRTHGPVNGHHRSNFGPVAQATLALK